MKLLPCVTLPALSYSCYFKKGCFLKGRMQHAALSHLRPQAENAAAHLELRQLPFTPHPSLRGFRNLQPQNRKAHPYSARKHRSLTPTHQGIGVLPQDRNGAQRVEVVTSECEKPPSDPTPVRGVPGSPNFLAATGNSRLCHCGGWAEERQSAAQGSANSSAGESGFDHCLFKALQLEAKEAVRTKYQLWKEIRTAHMTAARWHLRDSVSSERQPSYSGQLAAPRRWPGSSQGRHHRALRDTQRGTHSAQHNPTYHRWLLESRVTQPVHYVTPWIPTISTTHCLATHISTWMRCSTLEATELGDFPKEGTSPTRAVTCSPMQWLSQVTARNNTAAWAAISWWWGVPITLWKVGRRLKKKQQDFSSLFSWGK